MSVYSMVFSPAGGTEKVMIIFEEEFSCQKRIDLTSKKEDDKISFTREDTVLIGVPSYGGRVPGIALERIRRFSGNQAQAVLIVVYGNRDYDDTILELKNETQACGFRIAGAVAAIAEHSIMHQFAAGRPDAKDKKELREFARKIRKDINPLLDKKSLKIPGNTPYKEFGGLPLKPTANNKCTKCGLCAVKCPTGAIPEENPMLTDKEKCITCMRCTVICPNHARHLNPVLLFAASRKMEKSCAARKENELFI